MNCLVGQIETCVCLSALLSFPGSLENIQRLCDCYHCHPTSLDPCPADPEVGCICDGISEMLCMMQWYDDLLKVKYTQPIFPIPELKNPPISEFYVVQKWQFAAFWGTKIEDCLGRRNASSWWSMLRDCTSGKLILSGVQHPALTSNFSASAREEVFSPRQLVAGSD